MKETERSGRSVQVEKRWLFGIITANKSGPSRKLRKTTRKLLKAIKYILVADIPEEKKRKIIKYLLKYLLEAHLEEADPTETFEIGKEEIDELLEEFVDILIRMRRIASLPILPLRFRLTVRSRQTYEEG